MEGGVIDHVVVNVGVLQYLSRVSDVYVLWCFLGLVFVYRPLFRPFSSFPKAQIA